MPKPILYVSLRGPLVIPSSDAHPYLGGGIADYAKAFLGWAQDKFQVQVLTDENLRHVHVLAEHCGLKGDAIHPRGFELSKTEAMHPHDDFYWLDSELIPSEIAWLAKSNNYDRFVAVDPNVGVTMSHRDVLESLIKTSKRNRV
jgi:hypothetical protein